MGIAAEAIRQQYHRAFEDAEREHIRHTIGEGGKPCSESKRHGGDTRAA